MPRVLLLLVLALLPACDESVSEAGLPVATMRVQGVTFNARGIPPDSALAHLHDLGVQHLALTAFAFQRDPAVPELRFNPDVRWYSESDHGIRTLARQADSLGMRLVLKPHVWAGRGAFPGTIGFATEAEWEAWEATYRAFVLHQARLAAEVEAALFVVGTELHRAATEREAFWRKLIAQVRHVYPGLVTYAANWWEEYEDVPFWDALDFVGVQGYFPLSNAQAPALPALLDGWKPHVAALKKVARRTGKPILFTEIGYRSVDYAARTPWTWPSREEAEQGMLPDFDLQARLFEAFFRTFWEEPWCAGALVWKWEAGRSAPRPLDFTPQASPAEAVIARWFREAI